jgi:branched-chain amino acid transport system permease protein
MNLLIMLAGLVLSILVAQRKRPALSWAALAALAALGLLAPLLTQNLLTLTALFIAGTAAIGWNIIGGFTGYASFGQSAFFGLGGYTAAVMVARAPGTYGLPAWVGVLVGGVIPALVAIAIGVAVLRLKGHYFAIATLGIAIAVRELVNNLDCVGVPWSDKPLFCLGGASGIILPPVRRADLETTNLAFYFAALAMFAGGTAALWVLRHSKFGYGLRAIRANEEAAAVLGINITRFKVAAFAAGAVLTGLAGGLQGLVNGSVLPEQTSIFDPYRSLEVIIICLIGGAGTVWGPMVGTFTLYAVQEALFGVLGAGDWRPVFFGAFVIVLVLFLPRGILQFVQGTAQLRWRTFLRNLQANRV